MNRMSTLRLSLSAVLAATGAIATTSASAQTAAGVLTTATPTATTSGTAVKKPTSATTEMVNEAIQRSEARAAKERTSGVPQKWGSEEPFTYDPTIRRFNANQQ
jgi:hypothetical protein